MNFFGSNCGGGNMGNGCFGGNNCCWIIILLLLCSCGGASLKQTFFLAQVQSKCLFQSAVISKFQLRQA